MPLCRRTIFRVYFFLASLSPTTFASSQDQQAWTTAATEEDNNNNNAAVFDNSQVLKELGVKIVSQGTYISRKKRVRQ